MATVASSTVCALLHCIVVDGVLLVDLFSEQQCNGRLKSTYGGKTSKRQFVSKSYSRTIARRRRAIKIETGRLVLLYCALLCCTALYGAVLFRTVMYRAVLYYHHPTLNLTRERKTLLTTDLLLNINY